VRRSFYVNSSAHVPHAFYLEALDRRFAPEGRCPSTPAAGALPESMRVGYLQQNHAGPNGACAAGGLERL
jgi:hypothetical protein